MQPQHATPSGGAFSQSQVASEQAAFMRKVFGIMATGLAATGLTAFFVTHSPAARQIVFGNPLVFYGLLIAELAMVWSFSRVAQRFSAVVAGGLFFAYAILNGLTFSVFFMRYAAASIESTFFITAGMFAGLSAYGFVTKRDLTGLGNMLIMALWGLVLASLVAMFLPSSTLSVGLSVLGVIIFAGLTAYDVQKIKTLNVIGNAGSDDDRKEAINGALILYLDFVNLFIELLSLTGRRR